MKRRYVPRQPFAVTKTKNDKINISARRSRGGALRARCLCANVLVVLCLYLVAGLAILERHPSANRLPSSSLTLQL